MNRVLRQLPKMELKREVGAATRVFSVTKLWRETCIKEGMILLITPSSRSRECAQAVEAATGHPTHVASTLQEAGTKLRSQEYSAVIIDQFLLEAEPDGSDQMSQHLGTAIPV